MYLAKRLLRFPASGNRNSGSGAFGVTGATGYVWSAAVTGANGYYLGFDNVNVNPMNNYERARSYGVRCVQYLLVQLKVEG